MRQRSRNQAEISNVPRRHAGVNYLGLLASTALPAWMAVEVHGARQARPATSLPAIGISVAQAPANARVRVATVGQIVRNAGWAWAPGAVNYDGTGALTQGAGTRIGVALSPTEVMVLP